MPVSLFALMFAVNGISRLPLRHAVEAGLAPLAVGLVLARGWVMLKASDHGPRAWIVTAICTIIFTRTQWSPLLIVGLAALAGYLGWV